MRSSCSTPWAPGPCQAEGLVQGLVQPLEKEHMDVNRGSGSLLSCSCLVLVQRVLKLMAGTESEYAVWCGLEECSARSLSRPSCQMVVSAKVGERTWFFQLPEIK